jgi:asparagine synthase (glutamine-hydrolysing)
MFAFAIWDEPRRRLFLARDRLGKKPLYYHPLGERGVVFASELKALRLHPAVPDTVNPLAISQFLSLNYTLTSTCILKGVAKLPAGHSLVVDETGIGRPVSYWDLASFFNAKREWRSESQAAEELGALIEDSVRLRLISDVPLGAFLSGGLDSGTIVAAMCRLRPPAENRTFSIDFKEDGYSELHDARETARYLGVEHHDRTVSADMARSLGEVVWAADEPFADTSIIPTYHLARFAREHVTVCLSGDGGDEIFAGYETYAADRLRHATNWLPAPMTRTAERAVAAAWPVSFGKVSFDYKLRRFLAGHRADERRAHYSWREIFSADEKQRLLRDGDGPTTGTDAFADFMPSFEEVRDCHYLDQAMYVDLKTWLVDDIMVKVDRATMAHSLEVRAPLLDHRLVELAASLPVNWKLRRLRGKHLLKVSQRKNLPAPVIQRRKLGFNAPVSHWLRGGLGELAKEVTTDGGMDLWFNRQVIDELWRDHDAKRADNGLKLFGLTCLGMWLMAGK